MRFLLVKSCIRDPLHTKAVVAGYPSLTWHALWCLLHCMLDSAVHCLLTSTELDDTAFRISRTGIGGVCGNVRLESVENKKSRAHGVV